MDQFAKETLPISLEEEMRRSYLDCAMSVIVGRALPDVRDGLKPVHRRVLLSMNENGLGPTPPYVTCAGIAVGMATTIPPRNLREVIDATIAFIDEGMAGWGDVEVATALMKHMKGP